jgi:hypothetical protein
VNCIALCDSKILLLKTDSKFSKYFKNNVMNWISSDEPCGTLIKVEANIPNVSAEDTLHQRICNRYPVVSNKSHKIISVMEPVFVWIDSHMKRKSSHESCCVV